MIQLQNKKLIVGGINGSGKTYLVKYLSRFFNTIVYSPYYEEWKDEDVVFIKTTDFVNEFDLWCKKIEGLVIKNKVNLLIVDDADLLFKTQFDIAENFRRLHISNRHIGKGLAIVYVTRRPQDIPAKIYGTCELIAMFSLDSPQAIDLLNKIHLNFGEKVKTLQLSSFEFWLKEIGIPPVRMKV